VIRFAPACTSVNETDALLSERLRSALANPGSRLPEGCGMLEPGEVLMHDKRLQNGFELFWRPVCPHGCVPSTTPVVAPSHEQAGVYMRPTNPPKGWR
jgi:hypothetical protein